MNLIANGVRVTGVPVDIPPKTEDRKPNIGFKIPTPSPQVDSGNHQFAVSGGDEAVDLLEDLFDAHGAALAADVWNDAEGAAIIAAILNLEVGASAFIGSVENRRGEEVGVRED